MSSTKRGILTIIAALLAFSVEAAEPERPPDRDFLLRAAAAEIGPLASRHGLEVVGQVTDPDGGGEKPVFLVRAASTADPESVLDAVGGDPATENVEEAFLLSIPETDIDLNQRTRAILEAVRSTAPVLFDSPAAPGRMVWGGYVRQPAADLLRLAEAQSSLRGVGVVAVIDTGVDPDHPLLREVLLPGYDFTRDRQGSASEWEDLLDQRTRAILEGGSTTPLGDEEPVQLNGSTTLLLDGSADLDPRSVPAAFGHGTMVAGVIHRAAPGARILPLKAFTAAGDGHLFDVVRAIYYAVDHGAKVINMSFSLGAFSPELLRAVNYASRKGVTCVAAAGNDGEETIVYPAAYGNVIGVAATDRFDHLSRFSNYGSDLVTVAAPGEDVVTAYPGGGWALASGTSFAAPWVAGAVALFIEQNGVDHTERANYYISVDALAHSLPVHGFGRYRTGHGRMDARLALEELEKP